MEEPENGIHPSRIPQMLELVRSLSEDIEADDDEAAAPSIRQLIINTHSPLVVAELRDDELLFAETLKMKGKAFVNFKPLPGTWRQAASGITGAELITRGEILSYLSGHKLTTRSVKRTDTVGRLAESRAEVSQAPSTPDLFQQAKS
jgi:hypothetical protein